MSEPRRKMLFVVILSRGNPLHHFHRHRSSEYIGGSLDNRRTHDHHGMLCAPPFECRSLDRLDWYSWLLIESGINEEFKGIAVIYGLLLRFTCLPYCFRE